MPPRPPVGLTRTLLALLVALGLGGCAAVDAPGSGSRPWLVDPEPERPGVPDAVMLGDRVGSFHHDRSGL